MSITAATEQPFADSDVRLRMRFDFSRVAATASAYPVAVMRDIIICTT